MSLIEEARSVVEEPAVRADGKCALDGCEKKRQPPSKYADTSIDPFCSSTCCRVYYGVPLKETGPGPRTG